jgi:very-short-patch-repair endonuclease
VAPFDPAIAQALSKHGGVISRAQLLELGLSSSAIGRRVRAGEFKPVVPGVYRPATLRLTPELKIRAVALRLGPTCLIAGRSAAWWHGLTKAVTEPVAVILPPGSWPSTLSIVRAARRSIDPADRVVIRGVAVTGRARTVLDCADSLDAEDIRDAALQRGTTIWSLDRALERYGPGRGLLNARRLVDLARAGGVSSPERLALHALLRNGTEQWTAGVRVQLGPAEEYWLDLVIEDLKLCVEVDGWKVHSQAEAFHTDRDRQNVLALAGWTVLRCTPRRLRTDLDGAVSEILAMAGKLHRRRNSQPQRSKNIAR